MSTVEEYRIYYKLTCLKDMPGCKKGFSHTVCEDYLNRPRAILFSHNPEEQEAIETLVSEHDNTEFVKKEFDFDRAVDVLCPVCKKRSMFLIFYEMEHREKFYDPRTYKKLRCVLCGREARI